MSVERPDQVEPPHLYLAAEAADRYQVGAALRVQVWSTVNAVMFDLAGLERGRRVLDLAAGTGEQTIPAAQRVGPSGKVVAIDISTSMLEIAAEAVRQAGLDNVELRVMDAQRLELEPASFDAAICRCALMLIPDPVRASAEVRRVLKPGARFSAVVYSTPERNPWGALPLSIVRRRAGKPGPAIGQPGQFALGGPGMIEAVFEQAGFRDISVRAVPGSRCVAAVDQIIAEQRAGTPRVTAALADLDEAEREAAWAEIERAFRQFETPEGVEVPAEALVAVGTNQ
jgi:SAM-dependent methyltransferase